MSQNSIKQKAELKAVDFFCGGGGMSYGMKEAGIQVLAGIDFEPNCKKTYEANVTDAEFILADVFELKEKDLEKRLNIKKNDDNLIMIGCSPCQFWSIINTDKNKSQKSKNLLIEFSRFVEYFKPGYVVVENVPGVLRKKNESGLEQFINWLEDKNNGYKVHFDVHNVNDYGVAQNRKRFTLIANRVSDKEISPVKRKGEKITVRDVIGEHNGFKKITHGSKDASSFMHTTASLTNINLERLAHVKKDGGTLPLREYLASCLSIIERDWRIKRKDKKDKNLKDKTNIDVSKWLGTLPDGVQQNVDSIITILGNTPELSEDMQRKSIELIHDLVPEYPNLHWRHIHPELKRVSEKYYFSQDYYTAFIEALKRYIAESKKKVTLPDMTERQLMQAIWGGKKLSVTKKFKKTDGSSFSKDTIDNIEVGQFMLSEGIVVGGRNPLQHEEHLELSVTGLFSEKDCLDFLSLLSHLFKRLDDAEPY
jgi:DNA-cytosine methyltransferase